MTLGTSECVKYVHLIEIVALPLKGLGMIMVETVKDVAKGGGADGVRPPRAAGPRGPHNRPRHAGRRPAGRRLAGAHFR